MTLCGFDWPAGSTKQVVYRDENAHIKEMFVGMGGHWHVVDLTAITNAPLASEISQIVGFDWPVVGTKQVVYMDRNRHLQEMVVGVGGHWQVTDLTALTHAPLLDSPMIAGFAWSAAKTKQIIFTDSNYHIQEMFVEPGGQWQVADLTAITHAPLVDGSAIVGFDWPAAGTKQIVFIDSNGHIQELCVSMGGHWQIADLTMITGAPLADRGDLGVPLAGFSWSAGGTKQIVYRDRNRHIQEMYVGMGGRWQVTDLTMITGAPLANSIGGLTCFDWPAAGTKQVMFTDSNYHIHELHVGMGGHWQVTDLTEITHAPVLRMGSVSGYAWTAGQTKQVVYAGPKDSVQEMHVGMGGHWQIADLTVLADSLMLV